MSIRCRLGRHEAGSKIVWNHGYYVARCERCGIELIRQMHGRWQKVPKGHRIVWKPKPENYPDWSRIALLETPIAAFAQPEPAAPQATAPQGEVRLRIVPNAPAEPEAGPIPSFREWREAAAR